MKNQIKAAVMSMGLIISALAQAQTDPNAKIDLTLIAPANSVDVGDEIEVRLFASAQTTPQRYLVADIIFGWDNTKLQLLGLSHEESHPSIMLPPSGFPCPESVVQCQGIGGDYTGINEVIPPQDGNALYYGYGKLGVVFIIDEPVQIVKFRFKVLSRFANTSVYFIPELGLGETIVYGSYIPGLNTTGTLTNAIITGTPVIGDFDGNGTVNSSDLAMLMAAWGTQSFKGNQFDLDGNGEVDSADLGILLANWE